MSKFHVNSTFSIDRIHTKPGHPGCPTELTRRGFLEDLSFSEEEYQNYVREALSWYAEQFGIRPERLVQEENSDTFLVYNYENDSEPSFLLRPSRTETTHRVESGYNRGGRVKIIELVLIPLVPLTYGGKFALKNEGFDMSIRYVDSYDSTNLELDTLHYGYKIIEGPGGYMRVPFRSEEPSRTNSWGRSTQQNSIDHPDCEVNYCGREEITRHDQPINEETVHTSLAGVWRLPGESRDGKWETNSTSSEKKKDPNSNNLIMFIFLLIIIILIVVLLVWASRSRRRPKSSSTQH